VFGLPDWVVEEYDAAEQEFADGCTTLITDISRDVNAVIEDCEGIIAQARQDIDALVAALPGSLQTWARGESARIGAELDALQGQVAETQSGLNQDLADRANGAVQQVREQVSELREAAKGQLTGLRKRAAKAENWVVIQVHDGTFDDFWTGGYAQRMQGIANQHPNIKFRIRFSDGMEQIF
jgi:predicted trehalose synthase